MGDVLDVYQRPYDPARPVVCGDEKPVQLVGEVAEAVPAKPGQPERIDSEHVRNGTANVFVASEPLAGWRGMAVTGRQTAKDWAGFIRWLVDDVYSEAEVVVLVMDNLNTHRVGSLYEAFAAAEARRIASTLETHYTPKHGSWLNVAEVEFSVLGRLCLDRRIGSIEELTEEVNAWVQDRNDEEAVVDWQSTTEDARVKLKRLYPTTQ
jgi:hypothetical protein